MARSSVRYFSAYQPYSGELRDSAVRENVFHIFSLAKREERSPRIHARAQANSQPALDVSFPPLLFGRLEDSVTPRIPRDLSETILCKDSEGC